MPRAMHPTALLTKRGVVLALVVTVAFLGAGLGFLPELLGGPGDDAGASTTATTRPSDGTTETADQRDESATTIGDGIGVATDDGAPPATTTTESSDVVGTADDGTTDRAQTTRRGRTADSTRVTDRGTAGDSTSGDDSTPDGTAGDSTPDGETTPDEGTTTRGETTAGDETTTHDEPAAVGVEAEANATASSLAGYPTSSRRLNAVVNPPNAARTAGGA